MNTGIYLKGILCIDRKEVFHYYLSSKTFYYDIFSTFFTSLYYFFYSIFSISSSTLLLPIILKYNDLYIVIKKIKEKFLLNRKA